MAKTDKKERNKDKIKDEKNSRRGSGRGADKSESRKERAQSETGKKLRGKAKERNADVKENDVKAKGKARSGGRKHGRNGQLKLIFLGGVGEIGKNMTALEYGDTIIVVDAGMAFPDNEITPGIDSIIPDYAYLEENRSKVKAVLLTHAGCRIFSKIFPCRFTEATYPARFSSINYAATNSKKRHAK